MSRSKHRNVHVVPAGGRGFVARIAGGSLLFTKPSTQGIAIARASVVRHELGWWWPGVLPQSQAASPLVFAYIAPALQEGTSRHR